MIHSRSPYPYRRRVEQAGQGWLGAGQHAQLFRVRIPVLQANKGIALRSCTHDSSQIGENAARLIKVRKILQLIGFELHRQSLYGVFEMARLAHADNWRS